MSPLDAYHRVPIERHIVIAAIAIAVVGVIAYALGHHNGSKNTVMCNKAGVEKNAPAFAYKDACFLQFGEQYYLYYKDYRHVPKGT